MTERKSDEEQLAAALKSVVNVSGHRELILPLLLFVVGHRPLAFVVGQLLHMGTPSAVMMGWPHLQHWAILLSHPHGPGLVERAFLQRLPR
ncbi:MAG: hypothetical protein AAF702_35570 [Chloroflexota bacterium]